MGPKRLFQLTKYHLNRLIRPFNRIKLPIENRYHEPDDMMFYAIRAIFIDFVEKEMPLLNWMDDRYFELVRYTDIEEMQRYVDQCRDENPVSQEILDLYRWFKRTHPQLQKEVDALPAGEWYDRNQELHAIETQMMIRLITIRRHIWT